jgi:hypothetical protein
MPHIRPITDLRNTNEISELCHAQNEPVFITKNGYGDLVIMSMETYEALTASPAEAHPGRKTENLCYLTEQSPIWAGMLADVLHQHGIPFIQESSLGAGLALKTGSLSETIRFFVPASRLAAAEALTEELFAKGLEDRSGESPSPEGEAL